MSNEQRNTIWRFALIFIAIALGFIAVIGRIIYVQTVERDKWLSVAVHQDPVYQPIPATRGNILDCNGNPLATTTPTYYMLIDTKAEALTDHEGELFWQNVDTLAGDLARILKKKTKAEYRKILVDGYKKQNRELYLSNNVDYFQQKELARNPLIKRGRYQSGVYYKPRNERILPYGMLASRTIGGIYAENGQGKSGLEKEFNDVLSGTDGVCRVERIGGRAESITVRDAVDGLDVVTTIDANLQDIVENVLEEKVRTKQAEWGCCVLVETQTGYIRAIANLDRVITKDEKTNKADTFYMEVYNHAVRRVEPGSTFKTLSLMAMMNDGLIGIHDTARVWKSWRYQPTERKKDTVHITDSHKRDTVYTMQGALAASSNIAFARKVTEKYDKSCTKFVQALQRIGVPNDVYIEIPGYEKPWIQRVNDTLSLAKMSYGYVFEVSPITTLMYYNAIANNGRMMRPMLVSAIQYHGKDVRTIAPQVIRESVCSQKILNDIKLGLHDVVWDNNIGTASIRSYDRKIKAQSQIVSIAGKTGTAQVRTPGATKKGKKVDYDGRHHRITFVGYFPEENPQYTCICMIQNPGPPHTYDAGMDCGSAVKVIAEKVMAYTGCYVYKNGERKLEKR